MDDHLHRHRLHNTWLFGDAVFPVSNCLLFHQRFDSGGFNPFGNADLLYFVPVGWISGSGVEFFPVNREAKSFNFPVDFATVVVLDSVGACVAPFLWARRCLVRHAGS